MRRWRRKCRAYGVAAMPKRIAVCCLKGNCADVPTYSSTPLKRMTQPIGPVLSIGTVENFGTVF